MLAHHLSYTNSPLGLQPIVFTEIKPSYSVFKNKKITTIRKEGKSFTKFHGLFFNLFFFQLSGEN